MKKILNVMIFLTIIAVAGLLYSCCKSGTRTNSFTQDEQAWLFYTQGQQIVFVSNMGKYDTVVVFSVYRRFIDRRVDCATILNEDAATQISKNKISKYIIHLGKNDQGFYGDISCWDYLSYIGLQALPSPIASININGNQFTNVYKIEQDSTSLQSSNVYQFYFNKTDGILQYNYKSGESFYLVK